MLNVMSITFGVAIASVSKGRHTRSQYVARGKGAGIRHRWNPRSLGRGVRGHDREHVGHNGRDQSDGVRARRAGQQAETPGPPHTKGGRSEFDFAQHGGPKYLRENGLRGGYVGLVPWAGTSLTLGGHIPVGFSPPPQAHKASRFLTWRGRPTPLIPPGVTAPGPPSAPALGTSPSFEAS